MAKLEAIGRLAGGLAHEINTPAQYVSSDIQFLSSSCGKLLTLLGQYREALASGCGTSQSTEVLERIKAAEEDADLEFLEAELPGSAQSAREGIERIAEIVRAMKGFANPESAARLRPI